MIKIVTAYPDLLNLYGEYANIRLLCKRLESCGVQAEVRSFSVGSYVDITDADLLYFGAGTEDKMLAALDDFRRYSFGPASDLRKMLDNGGRLLCTGNAMALFCREVTDARTGRRYEGAGLVDGTAAIRLSNTRYYGEVLCDCSLCGRKVAGVINSSIDFTVEGEHPFVDITWDSSKRLSGPEGFLKDGVCATELTGPLLVRNPDLLEAVAGWLAPDLPACRESWAAELELGYRHVLETLENAK